MANFYQDNTTGDGVKIKADNLYTNNQYILDLHNSSGQVAYIGSDGIWYAADYGLTSDPQLKDQIVRVPHDVGLDMALKLHASTWRWKESWRGFDEQIGFISTDVKEAHPSLVSMDRKGYEQVHYPRITAINNAAIHELNNKLIDEIKRLEGRIKELENERT